MSRGRDVFLCPADGTSRVSRYGTGYLSHGRDAGRLAHLPKRPHTTGRTTAAADHR